MKIEALIEKIRGDETNGAGNIAAEIMDAVTSLVSRLEGMLPDIETARRVAQQLGIQWEREPNGAMLAWAWTIWPAYEEGKIAQLGEVVLPLLPPGQPFGQSEIDAVRGHVLLAEVEGGPALDEARSRAQQMAVHNIRVACARGGGLTFLVQDEEAVLGSPDALALTADAVRRPN